MTSMCIRFICVLFCYGCILSAYRREETNLKITMKLISLQHDLLNGCNAILIAYNSYDTERSTWWLVMLLCLFGTKASVTLTKTQGGRRISGVTQRNRIRVILLPIFSGLLHWHCDDHVSEDVTLKDMGKSTITHSQQNTIKRGPCA